MKKKLGTVYLVGAGPGDPDLITLKAQHLLKSADKVFYDYLVPSHWIDSLPTEKCHYVGKRGHAEAIPQEKIIELLIEAAQGFKKIVRLKGGDPFIFGRGGEETQALAKANIPFEIVPGVSSAIAVPSYAGIPLTHRNFGSAVTFVAGHRDPLKKYSQEDSLNWAALAKQNTLVFLMGVKNLAQNFSLLQENGMSSQTPAAIIEWGSLGRQRSLFSTLEKLPQLAKAQKYQSPAIVVVGEIVRLGEELQWFEKKLLSGKKILVTRSHDQTHAFSKALRELGADAIEFPTIKLTAPDSWEILDAALEKLPHWEYLIFTSVNAVDFFLQRLREKNRDIRQLVKAKVIAVGDSTAKRLREALLQVHHIPKSFHSSALIDFFEKENMCEVRVLFPRAEKGNDHLVKALHKMGAELCLAPIYKNQMPLYTPEEVERRLGRAFPDLLTFTSSSCVENFYKLLNNHKIWPQLKKIPCIVIGPETKKTAMRHGFQVNAVAEKTNLEGMIAKIKIFFS